MQPLPYVASAKAGSPVSRLTKLKMVLFCNGYQHFDAGATTRGGRHLERAIPPFYPGAQVFHSISVCGYTWLKPPAIIFYDQVEGLMILPHSDPDILGRCMFEDIVQ